MDKVLLAERIAEFVENYAGVRPDFDYLWDDFGDKYTSPDVYEMLSTAENLYNDEMPDYPHSSWESGGYIPYNSEEGRREHNFLLNEIKLIIKDK